MPATGARSYFWPAVPLGVADHGACDAEADTDEVGSGGVPSRRGGGTGDEWFPLGRRSALYARNALHAAVRADRTSSGCTTTGPAVGGRYAGRRSG